MFLTPYHVPSLNIPFQVVINPENQAFVRQILDWVRYSDLIKTSSAFKRFDASKFWLLSAATYPNISKEDLHLINQWVAWLYIQDDHFDEARVGRQMRRLQSYVEAAVGLLRQPRLATVREDGALLSSLSELWQRLRDRMGNDLAARFIMAFDAYTTACLWELDNRAFGYTPTENEYIIIRRDTSAFRLMCVLIEMTLPEPLPVVLRDHPVLRKMQDLANDVRSWTNDIYSFEKEAKRKDPHNLVYILSASGSLTTQEAMDAVAARIDGAVQQFIELEAALPIHNRESAASVHHYITGLKAWMAGNLYWIQQTARYEQELGYVDQSDAQRMDSDAS